MTHADQRKNHKLSMRLSDVDFALINRAAQRRGCSRSAFIRDAAVRAAEDVIMDNMLARVSPKEFSALFKTTAIG